MEDLYSDLENYNEVYATEELRKENQQLKLTLEEYKTAMEKLQKDYDTLSSEFHNLQINFSSLLKTARAEVERKAQIITQLNIDKDMRVLQAFQSGNNKKSQNKRSAFMKGTENPEKAMNVKHTNTETKTKIDLIPKNIEIKNERCKTSSVSTNISAPSSDSTKLNIFDKIVEKVEACLNKGELKENNSHCNPKHKDIHIHKSNFRNKRKSIGDTYHRQTDNVDKLPKFSSDEESEPEKHLREHRINNKCSDTSITRNINPILSKISNETLSTKTSEISSSMDGSSNNLEEPRDKNSYRASRHYENDKYRKSDRETDRSRQNDRYKESSRSRDRRRESDKYRVSGKYNENDRYRESDSYRDKNDPYHRYRKYNSPDRSHKRSYRDYQDDLYRPDDLYGRHRQEFSHYEVHGQYPPRNERRSIYDDYGYDYDRIKHCSEERSSSKRYDVPNSKRQKLESVMHLDEKQKYSDHESIVRLPQNDMEQYDVLSTSCQSPDVACLPETHKDLTPAHTIKEIKSTASAPLDDPRITSKKYILKTENGKPVLYTYASQIMDIKPVDKSLWNIESIPVPDALLHEPQPNSTTVNIKDMYDKIENLESQECIKIGLSDSNSSFKNNLETDTKLDGRKKLKDFDLTKNIIEVPSKQVSRNEHVAKVTANISSISDGKKNTEIEATNISKDLAKIIEHATNNTGSRRDTNINLPLIDTHDHDIMPTNKLNNKPYDCDKSEQSCTILSNMAMVREDLDLSDETSDNFELHKKNVTGEAKVHKLHSNLETKLNSSNETKESANVANKEKREETKLINVQDDKHNETAGHKKHKSKRKKSKLKDMEIGNVTDNPAYDNKTFKKDKSSKPKQIKSKFSDLFGDSSSLITPEDLGIPASCVPLCEDAQDAVDMNIEICLKPVTNSGAKETCSSKKTINEEGTNMETTNTDNKVISLNIEEKTTSPQLDSNIVYQNVNYESTNKADAGKTVIISSGVQPQFILDDTSKIVVEQVADVDMNIQNIVNCIQLPTVTELKKANSMNALATSTPHKELSTLNIIETDCSRNDNVTDSSSKTESDDRLGLVADMSDRNTQNSRDPPDVRIFIRRRKKAIKKS